MKVFISWSGGTSRAVAVALSEWFPKVLQGVKPFVSAKDIDKGANWTVVLTEELETSDFGVVCLAADNLQSPWLHYEAGAISKSVSSRVCPVLFGVEVADVQRPMSQLQITKLDRADMFQLMKSMNKVSPLPLLDADVQEAVDMWWPSLETKLSKIDAPAARDLEPAPEPPKPEVVANEMIEEVLRRMRSLDTRFQAFEDSENQSGFNRSPRIRRKESVQEANLRMMTPSDVRDQYHMALLQIADAHGLNATKGSITADGGVEVHVANPVPDPLSWEFIEAVTAVTSLYESPVRFIGPNRTANFTNGQTTEVPF